MLLKEKNSQVKPPKSASTYRPSMFVWSNKKPGVEVHLVKPFFWKTGFKIDFFAPALLFDFLAETFLQAEEVSLRE